MNDVFTPLACILAVEDDPVLGAYLQQHLQDQGFSVTWCRDGCEGLRQALRQLYALVLLDILLPGMNGLELLSALRRRQNTPVILLTALGSEADRISGFAQGADDLPKPFSMAELRVRIDAILRRVALERQRPAAPITTAAWTCTSARSGASSLASITAPGRFVPSGAAAMC